MVSSDHHHPTEESQNLTIHSIKLSSVGPGDVTGPDLIYEPENIDLAMKLHYLRGVYYFKKEAFEGLTTLVIKEPMFTWLNTFPVVSGRFRRVESGRPYIKCNDCGVRFVEAKCDKNLDQWLENKDATMEKKLVPGQVLGPELGFSPLVFIQLTKFKCGGTALGLSWAHVLGDAFTAAVFVNMLGQVVAGHEPPQPITLTQTHTKSPNSNGVLKPTHDPISIKRVAEPVGDHWVNPTKSDMEAFSFHIVPSQLNHLQSKIKSESSAFEAISALIWQCVAKIRDQQDEPRAVTICKGSGKTKTHDGILSNGLAIGIVKADSAISKADLNDLSKLIAKGAIDEREKIEEAVERENGLADFFVYGANLTFVDLEEAGFYEFDYRGQKPVNVSCWIDGVGDQGAVLVLPGSNEGRDVTVILPENEIAKLKSELSKEGFTCAR